MTDALAQSAADGSVRGSATGRDRRVGHANAAQDEGARLVDQLVERALVRHAARPGKPASAIIAATCWANQNRLRGRAAPRRPMSPAATAASSEASNSGTTRSDTVSNSSRA